MMLDLNRSRDSIEEMSREDTTLDDENDVVLTLQEKVVNAPTMMLNPNRSGDSNEDMSRDDTTMNEHSAILTPMVGMTFATEDEVKEFYSHYAMNVGFGISIRDSVKREDGKVSNLLLTCAREGKPRHCKRNAFKPNPTIKTNCKARIRAILRVDGLYALSVVENVHSHELSPSKARHFRSSKKIHMHAKRMLELNDRAGIRLNKNFSSLVVEAGGYENLPFSEKNCRDYVEKTRKWKLEGGDGQALQKYFARMQDNNSNFYYLMDMDDDLRVRNVFWADARSRASYESFGDVVTFDTTYLTNKYDMPFAPFVGVNHHGQSILLGCGLLSNENTETFIWLFMSWLKCMSSVSPKAIITDQCKAMQNAIEFVFPNIQHRWCLWHIMKKLPEKLGGYTHYESIMYAIKNVVHDSLTISEFENRWEALIDRCKLQSNRWLEGLYQERHRWVPAFVKGTFWAGMSTTQRSESMNAFFDKYVTSTTTLKEFVDQYDNALRNRAEKETLEDFKSFNSIIPCVTSSPIEKVFQETYTQIKFMEVQSEFRGKVNCYAHMKEENETTHFYEVREDAMVMETIRELLFNVVLDLNGCDVKCTCRLFEFRGILCRHALLVLTLERVTSIPHKYILARWRKDLKRKHTYVRSSYDDIKVQPQMQRYDKMCKEFYELAELVADDEKKTKVVVDAIRGWRKRATSDDFETIIICPSAQFSVLVDSDNECAAKRSKTDGNVLSPIVVQRKGRPPFKRKMSRVEEIIKRRVKKRKKIDQAEKVIKPNQIEVQERRNEKQGRTNVENSPNQPLSTIPGVIQNGQLNNVYCGGYMVENFSAQNVAGTLSQSNQYPNIFGGYPNVFFGTHMQHIGLQSYAREPTQRDGQLMPNISLYQAYPGWRPKE